MAMTLTPLRILCLVDGPVIPPDKWIWNWLPAEAQADVVDFMHVTPPDLFPGWGKIFTYYPAYLALAVRAFRQARSRRYDAIVAWESKFGFPLAALRALLHVQDPPLVVLDFCYKGIATHFRTLSRFIVKGMDRATVDAPSDPQYYHQLLKIPLDKLIFCPLGWHDIFQNLDGADQAMGESARLQSRYVFAGGRSDRDYATLFSAADGLDCKFVVNARPFNVQGLTCPPNLKVNVSASSMDYARAMRDAMFIVLPLQDVPFSTGNMHMIQAMSAGKALVATRSPNTEYYIEDGKAGILVRPRSVEDMRAAISYLLTHPAEMEAMGRRARRRWEEQFTAEAGYRRQYDVIRETATSRRQTGPLKLKQS